MPKIIIASLIISLIIVIILFLRERTKKKMFQKDVKFFENEKTSFLSLQKRITSLEEEKAALAKKNGKFFWAEIRYTRIFRSQRRKISSLSKKNKGLKFHLNHYEEIKVVREREYTNLN